MLHPSLHPLAVVRFDLCQPAGAALPAVAVWPAVAFIWVHAPLARAFRMLAREPAQTRDRWLVQCSAPFMSYELASMQEYKPWCASATLCTCVCWRTVQCRPSPLRRRACDLWMLVAVCLEQQAGCPGPVLAHRATALSRWCCDSSHSCNRTNSTSEAQLFSSICSLSPCLHVLHASTTNMLRHTHRPRRPL